MSLKLILPTNTQPMRLQVACFGKLVFEVVCENYTAAQSAWAKYAVEQYRANRPAGGAIIQRADLPRYWDVPVGTDIRPEEQN